MQKEKKLMNNYTKYNSSEILQKVAKIRKDKGVTIQHLAETIGMSINGLQKALKNEDLRLSAFFEILNTLQIEPDQLFGGKYDNFKADLFKFLKGDINAKISSSQDENINFAEWDSPTEELTEDEEKALTEFRKATNESVLLIQEKLSVLYLNTIYKDPFLFEDVSKISNESYPSLMNFFLTNQGIYTPLLKKKIFQKNDIWIHPINIVEFLQKVYKIKDQTEIQKLQDEVHLRELKFIKHIEESLFVNWLLETNIIDSSILKSIIMQISREKCPTFK